MQIQRLTVDDTAFAMGAAHLFKGQFPDPDVVVDFLSSAQNILLIAEEEGIPLGFLLAYRLNRWDQARPMMFVYEVEVREPYRRQGIGRALLGEIQRISRKAGYLKLFLMTNASNEAAMALYAATGARRTADDDVLLTYDLT
ncbi:MAG: GNAT family N-acetyltransferase [Anaerolineae bacterium]|nr:GNAT family N-acetyltransferase [Anaerolineae bacterium]